MIYFQLTSALVITSAVFCMLVIFCCQCTHTQGWLNNGVDMFEIRNKYMWIATYLSIFHNTLWWQPLGKDTQAFRRQSFHAFLLWMLSCDWTFLWITREYMWSAREYKEHKGVSFYVVCWWVIIWHHSPLQWCHDNVSIMLLHHHDPDTITTV